MDLNMVIEQVGRERGIDRGVLVETLEAALKTAAKKVFGEERDIEAQFNEDTGDIELFLIITVAGEIENPYREITVAQAREYIDPNAEVGDELLFQLFYREEELGKAKEQDDRYGAILNLESARRTFGRIAAQTAKQVIIQRVREAERQNIYDEFKDRKHELITGIVRRFEKGAIIVDLHKADAILPASEQTRRESYRPGDRIQGYVKDVVRSARDAQIVLSRTDPGLVIKLFEQEVPEIFEGIVKIVAVAREPGVRSKVAVYSTDSDVDPVGACVGMRGSRVQSVVQELRGEKIDIVPYHSDSARFVCNAISPAQVAKVLIDEAKVSMELIVPDDQLSLAIGRGGQNVRLAAQLTGWNLEIYSESRLRQLMAEAKEELLEFEGVDEAMIDTLFGLGYNKLEDISLAEIEELAQLPGFNEAKAYAIVDAATSLVSKPADGSAPVTEEDVEREALQRIRGIGAAVAVAVHAAGYTKPLHLVYETDADRLAAMSGIDGKKAKQLLGAAEKWHKQQRWSEEELSEQASEGEEFREELAERFEDFNDDGSAD
ncbi:MAG: transcription termination/antitermination protein NusA [Myxococcales bacterium]|nr:transcription termination/antitermination protein NusA [Myxococcales bacterium]MCB9520717.1 transcription termination/antitermination protein NusA [Myxococcales bacterium]MCB9532121.1 transcription termination/antitermination protein NusA [Myxococcales bacterium]